MPRGGTLIADKLVLMRYRHKDEANWKLVPFEFANASTAWKPGNIPVVSPAPFQWAGAANSPQLQADGSKRYIPQLVMGWVKRVLDRINPYEARYTDFFVLVRQGEGWRIDSKVFFAHLRAPSAIW